MTADALGQECPANASGGAELQVDPYPMGLS